MKTWMLLALERRAAAEGPAEVAEVGLEEVAEVGLEGDGEQAGVGSEAREGLEVHHLVAAEEERPPEVVGVLRNPNPLLTLMSLVS